MSEPITHWNVWVASAGDEDEHGWAWPIEVRAPDRDTAARLGMSQAGPAHMLVEVTPLEYGCRA